MYETLSDDYDRFVNWDSRLAYEMPFIEKQIGMVTAAHPPLRILDAACGTGMHAIALAQKGFSVSAADLFPEMITRSQENAAQSGVNIDARVAGFGNLAKVFGSGQFDLLLCLGNSLPHVLSEEELHRALTDFADCLRPGGVLLIIQNRNFDAVMANKARWMEPQSYKEGDNEWLFQRFYDFEPNSLIHFNIVTLKREDSGEWRSSVSSTLLLPLLHDALLSALSKSGFDRIRTYGNMDSEPFIPMSSPNLIIIAHKSK
jgi:SAM-dependent methyltransferase